MLVGVTHFGKYMDHEIEINILNFRRIFNFQDVYTKNCLINSICFDDKLKLGISWTEFVEFSIYISLLFGKRLKNIDFNLFA